MPAAIIRRPDLAGGGVTESERERLALHAREWTQNAFRTGRTDRAALAAAIRDLYRVSCLPEPCVVVVPSPIVVVLAGGIAAVWWYAQRLKEAGLDITEEIASLNAMGNSRDFPRGDLLAECVADDGICDVTRAVAWHAVKMATDHAMDVATRVATHAPMDADRRIALQWATDEATAGGVTEATVAAIAAATHGGTDAILTASAYEATIAAIRAATDGSTSDGANSAARGATAYTIAQISRRFLGEHHVLGLRCAARWFRCCQGGHMESQREYFLTAARDVLGLRLPSHDRYAAWERCAKLGGFRWMHPEFCLASDFPDYIRINSRGQPHCETGPSHRWSDGWSVWHLNGVRVPQWLVETHADGIESRNLPKLQCYTAAGREFVRRVGIERIRACTTNS